MCHRVKHIGFWAYSTKGNRILTSIGLSKADLANHFCEVNGCTMDGFIKHEKQAFKIWNKRSEIEWKQDFGKYSKDLII